MDNLARILGKMLWITNHSVIEARANSNQHIAMLHRHVGLVGAMHPGHSDELLVRERIGTQSHQSISARCAHHFDELMQLRRGIRQNHAAAAVDHRPLGLQQHLHRFFDLTLVTFDDRRI